MEGRESSIMVRVTAVTKTETEASPAARFRSKFRECREHVSGHRLKQGRNQDVDCQLQRNITDNIDDSWRQCSERFLFLFEVHDMSRRQGADIYGYKYL